MQCDQTKNIQAYHDGQMSRAIRDAFEAHLAACGICGAELDQLRRLSTHLAAASIPSLSKDAMGRFHRTVKAAEERGVLRLAEWLTAAAAAILLVGVIGIFRHETTHAAAPAAWAQAAVAYPAYADSSDRADLAQMAE